MVSLLRYFSVCPNSLGRKEKKLYKAHIVHCSVLEDKHRVFKVSKLSYLITWYYLHDPWKVWKGLKNSGESDMQGATYQNTNIEFTLHPGLTAPLQPWWNFFYKEETFIKILIEYLSRQSFLVCSKSFYETDLDQISIRTGEFSVAEKS